MAWLLIIENISKEIYFLKVVTDEIAKSKVVPDIHSGRLNKGVREVRTYLFPQL